MQKRLAVVQAAAVAVWGSVAAAQQSGAPAKEAATLQAESAPPASETTPPPATGLDATPTRLTIDVEPATWFAGINGKLKMPRSAPSGRADDRTDILDLNMDNPRFVPFGEVNVRSGDWRFAVRGFSYDADKANTGVEGQIGDVVYTTTDTLQSSLHFASYEFEGAYTVSGGQLNKASDGIYALDTKFDVVGGVRVYDVGWDIRKNGGGAGAEATDGGTFFLPEAGVKLNMEFYRDYTIDLQVTVGGNPAGSSSSYSGDIVVGFAYRPTTHFGVQLGYRSLFFGVGKGKGDGEFSFSGAVQGLYGGLVFRF